MDATNARKLYAFLVNNITQVKDVTVTWQDGSQDSGFVHHAGTSANGSDLVILCRHSALRNQDPNVVLDFDKAQAVEVELAGGSVTAF